jgi:dCTP deaminase
MVLTDREIQAAIDNHQIIIEPRPPVAAYSSTSLDLTLSKFLRIWRTAMVAGVDQIVIPSAPGYTFSDFSKAFSDAREITGDGYVIDPGAFVLGWTEEDVELPAHARLAARVEGKR